MKLTTHSPTANIEVVPSVDKLALIGEKGYKEQKDLTDGFFLCNLGDILSKYQHWMNTFPRIQPYHPVKCNPDDVLIKTLLSLEVGFNCVNKGEIHQVLSLGARPEQIIFCNPCKQSSHVRYSRDNDVKLVVFDSKEELTKIKKNHPNAELILCIQAEVRDSQSDALPGANVKSAYSLIDAVHSMGLKLTGISFHAEGHYADGRDFSEAFQNIRSLFDHALTLGYRLSILGIGDVLPSTDCSKVGVEEFACALNLQINNHFPLNEFGHMRVVAESGRYLVSSAYSLATKVIAKKQLAADVVRKNPVEGVNTVAVRRAEDDPSFVYCINDGLYGAFNCLLYGCDVKPMSLKAKTTTAFSSTILGPSCDGLERIVNASLPELDEEDWLVWNDMGAYTIPTKCSFNRPKSAMVYYVISENDFTLFCGLTGSLGLPGVNFTLKGKQDKLFNPCGKTPKKKLSLLQNDDRVVPDIDCEAVPVMV